MSHFTYDLINRICSRLHLYSGRLPCQLPLSCLRSRHHLSNRPAHYPYHHRNSFHYLWIIYMWRFGSRGPPPGRKTPRRLPQRSLRLHPSQSLSRTGQHCSVLSKVSNWVFCDGFSLFSSCTACNSSSKSSRSLRARSGLEGRPAHIGRPCPH